MRRGRRESFVKEKMREREREGVQSNWNFWEAEAKLGLKACTNCIWRASEKKSKKGGREKKERKKPKVDLMEHKGPKLQGSEIEKKKWEGEGKERKEERDWKAVTKENERERKKEDLGLRESLKEKNDCKRGREREKASFRDRN